MGPCWGHPLNLQTLLLKGEAEVYRTISAQGTVLRAKAARWLNPRPVGTDSDRSVLAARWEEQAATWRLLVPCKDKAAVARLDWEIQQLAGLAHHRTDGPVSAAQQCGDKQGNLQAEPSSE